MSKYTKIKNRDWIQQSFMLESGAISDADMQRRLLTMASWKFTDTTVGGNFSINNPPQYTRFADIKTGGLGSLDTPVLDRMGQMLESTGRYLTGLAGDDYRPSPSHSRGMGRYYSEQMDDPGVNVSIRFGVPQFNSLTRFFGAFYDPQASAFARTAQGEMNFFNMFYTAGKVATTIVTLPLQPIILGGKALKFISGNPPSKFYYLKPAMPMYWNAVNTIVNTIAVNMGIIPAWTGFGDEEYTKSEKAVNNSVTAEYMQRYANGDLAGSVLDPQAHKASLLAMADAINPDFVSGQGGQGGIDVRAMALRAQSLAERGNRLRMAALNNVNELSDYRSNLMQVQNKVRKEGYPNVSRFDAYIKAYLDVTSNSVSGAKKKLGGAFNIDGSADVELRQQYNTEPSYGPKGDLIASGKYNLTSVLGIMGDLNAGGAGTVSPGGDGSDVPPPTSPSDTSAESAGAVAGLVTNAGEFFSKYLGPAINEGAEFVTFRIDNPGNISESFSNSTRESDVAGKINSMSGGNRNKRFDFAGGNVGDGVIAGIAEGVIKAAGAVVSGVADTVGMSGLSALAGSAFVDIPKHWDQSIAQLPRASFTIQLRSPYGNKLSRLQNLYIPLSMLLAGALPLAAGPHSFTSPFICELYSKGRLAIRLGMIESLSISRGQGNVGWTEDGEPLGIDVTFEVADLSTIMHMPIGANLSMWEKVLAAAGEAAGGEKGVEAAMALAPSTYDEDSSYNDYLAVLGSLGIQEMALSREAKWTLRRARSRAIYQTWRTPANMAIWTTGATVPGRVMQALVGYGALDR